MARVYERTASPAPEPSASADTRFILLALALAVVLVLHLVVDTILGSFTRSESAIATVKSVLGPSARSRGLTVLETDGSLYVLRGYVNARKGASLVLRTRFNGDNYVCHRDENVCVQTASVDLADAEVAQPSASSPASGAGIAQ